ncbi:unnamed protein product [Angiostrongylus costaricensis]|uniref:MIF4G domain-containing protein n=1 Tax=Angiostrongylus costaricensis TaxID=334426 RepID=A0A0R3PKF8_ANGCS|nr:unnamed protein product [Angiostrongylus costaricensis]
MLSQYIELLSHQYDQVEFMRRSGGNHLGALFKCSGFQCVPCSNASVIFCSKALLWTLQRLRPPLFLCHYFSNCYCSSLSFVNFILQDSGGRIDKVGEALLEQLDDLLKLEMNDQLMKTIVQLLCGRSLDASEATEPSVSQLLTKLVAFAKGHPQLSESVKTQIMSVVELRKNGWGVTPRVSGAASDAVPSSSSLSVPSNEADVIVGEDGVALELNEEERSFLESHIGKDLYVICSGLDDPEQDQSFDEQEVLKDFGAFVKEEEDRKTTSMLEKLEVCDRDN